MRVRQGRHANPEQCRRRFPCAKATALTGYVPVGITGRMEATLILPLLGLVLPPRYALRLAAVGIIALLAFGVFGNKAYDPGAGHGLGLAILIWFVILFFGAILLGLAARGLWHLWRISLDDSAKPGLADLSVPPLLDQLLAGLAMIVPAGLLALALGDFLAGSGHPLLIHIGLLVAVLSLGVVALIYLDGLPQAATLGLSIWLAFIVADSMRLEGQMMADVTRQAGALPQCLAIGPEALAPGQLPPLMGLTAPKPILLRIAHDGNARLLRWSFRWHGFVRGGINEADVRCLPAPP